MATSGSKSVSVTSYDTLKFSWSRTGYSTANNTSTISWKLELIASSSGYISSSASKAWSVNVNGTKYSGTNTVGISSNTTKTLASGSTTISHNSDGTKTFSYSFSQQFDITFSGSKVGTVSGSGTGTLTTIARVSTFAISGATLGSAQTITVTRQNTAFTHTLTWVCGSYSGTICDKSTSTTLTFTPSLDLANGAPNSTSAYCKYTLTTYNGSTSIGTSDKVVWLAIPESVKPSCSIAVSDANGYADVYGGYIQAKSKLSVKVNATQAYNSKISKYAISADGYSYTSSEFISNEIRSSSDFNVSATVTDTRGRTGSATTSVTVIPYSEPKILMLKVHRCDADGTENISGEYCKAEYSYTITSLDGQNKKAASILYKKSKDPDSDYTEIALTAGYNVENQSTIFPADGDSSYIVRLQLTDSFSQSPSYYQRPLSVAFCLWHTATKWDGITFGGICEEPGFINHMDAKFYGSTHFAGGLTEDIIVMSSGNCDDILTSGQYYIGNTGTGKPVDLNGWLTVKAYDSGNYCYQNYMTYTGEEYYRMRDAGTWLEWIRTNADSIIETGTSGIWSYRKWNSGLAECWGRYGASGVNASKNSYQGFYYSDGISVGYPFTFVKQPTLFTDGGATSSMLFATAFGGTTAYASFHMVCHVSTLTSVAINVSLSSFGKWK